MAWQGLEGHDAIAERFVAAQARGRIAGSYLFVGPAGVGKGTFALALAKSLVCQAPQPGLVACGNCASCVQAAAGSHPDIDVVRKPDDKSTIPLDLLIGDDAHRMREGLCWRILLRPALGGRKVAVIMDADHFSEESANCLLKTLEEPPDAAAIILVGTALERQLPTIRSRCQVIRFAPLPADVVRRVIEKESHATATPLDSAALDACARASGGSLVRARLLLDPEVVAFRAGLLEILAQRPLHGVALSRDTTAFVEAAGKDAPPRRARLRIALESALDVFRRALRRTAGHAGSPDDRAAAAWAVDPDAATAAIETTLETLDAVDRNANLSVLIDAWTAVLEEPRLARQA
ncbi:MAG: AAA family ATPase [Planctomycetia bacterium]|nr:AAA family ATPase [Planctomycetia bacterium]